MPYLLMICILISQSLYADDPDACFVVNEVIRGKECGKPNGIRINFSNSCSQAMDAKYCLEYAQDKWSCGVYFGVKPQEKHAAWTCESTGQYKLWGRSVSFKAPFPDIDGTYKKQGDQLYATDTGETEASACKRAQIAANNGGPCECEPNANTDGFQCRTAISALPANAKAPANAFKNNEFSGQTIPSTDEDTQLQTETATSAGSNADQVCAAARALLEVPDADCQCTLRGSHAICKATALKPAPKRSVSDRLIYKLKDTLRQNIPPAPNPTPTTNVGSGRRG